MEKADVLQTFDAACTDGTAAEPQTSPAFRRSTKCLLCLLRAFLPYRSRTRQHYQDFPLILPRKILRSVLLIFPLAEECPPGQRSSSCQTSILCGSSGEQGHSQHRKPHNSVPSWRVSRATQTLSARDKAQFRNDPAVLRKIAMRGEDTRVPATLPDSL